MENSRAEIFNFTKTRVEFEAFLLLLKSEYLKTQNDTKIYRKIKKTIIMKMKKTLFQRRRNSRNANYPPWFGDFHVCRSRSKEKLIKRWRKTFRVRRSDITVLKQSSTTRHGFYLPTPNETSPNEQNRLDASLL